MDDQPSVVLDNGSGSIKAGYGGDDAPRVYFPSLVGRPFHSKTMPSVSDDLFVGDKCQNTQEILSLSYPLEHGIVKDWDAMETIWRYVFSELRVLPEETQVLLTEPLQNPAFNREMSVQVMFESLEVPGLYLENQSVLSLYASGRGIGMVLNVGDTVSHVLPIYEGYALPSAGYRVDFGGRDITVYLSELLRQRDVFLTTTSEMETARKIKESLGYVAKDFDQEMLNKDSMADQEYKLPDGQKIHVGTERFQCAEALFQPNVIGHKHEGIHQMVFNAMMKCDSTCRRDLWCNIIVMGGSTTFPSFQNRMQIEMERFAPQRARVKVVAYPERKFSVWIGGSILSSLSTFQTYWITRNDYEEYGPEIVHRKCPPIKYEH